MSICWHSEKISPKVYAFLTMSKLLRLVSPSKVAKTLNTANNVSRGF